MHEGRRNKTFPSASSGVTNEFGRGHRLRDGFTENLALFEVP